MAKFIFRFEDEKLETKVVVQEAKGLSILEVTEDHDIHLNHNCGEVCACSTCHIYVEQGNKYLQEISDREEDFIDRAIDPRIESRLGCQCVVLNEEGEFEVIIPDQSGIIGHEH
ncbi:2Fe-2S iron-sulfur cluster-binding protein [Saprospiraceae bacterium]|jgi:2Fe-2S ferredoxin|nr:2Fe-2S iron-sulfur cluster-binding protein [Saprospiraceae bacterium]MDB9914481.1 2Fe-2S iron-sulfur cluster-binding protein [Saprospiraceae bacterium]HCV51105.1 ferredoxin [Saprospirales bacterium]